MNQRQLSDRIGNLDDRLVQRAERIPNYGLQRRKSALRRAAALAAVIVLMVCSGAVGAVAFSRETVVEVPVEPEAVTLEEIGLTLILPDSWRGQYAVTRSESGSYVVYSPQIKEAWGGSSADPFDGGVLFYIVLWEEQLTKAQVEAGGEWSVAGCRYVMTTGDGTYLLYYASDVQFSQDMEETYRRMGYEIKDIRFVIDNPLAAGAA